MVGGGDMWVAGGWKWWGGWEGWVGGGGYTKEAEWVRESSSNILEVTLAFTPLGTAVFEPHLKHKSISKINSRCE